jgi:hypothetical protein
MDQPLIQSLYQILEYGVNNPEKVFDRLRMVDDCVRNYLPNILKYLKDILIKLERLRSTDYRFKHALKVAEYDLRKIVLKVREYVDMADQLCVMASENEEATIHQQIELRIDKKGVYYLENRPSFPKLEDFVAKLDTRISDLDTIHSEIKPLCDKFLLVCTEGCEVAQWNEIQVRLLKKALRFIAVVLLVVFVFVVFTRGVLTIAFNRPIDPEDVKIILISTLCIPFAYILYKWSNTFSKRETEFCQKKKKFDELQAEALKVRGFADEVAMLHTGVIKTELKVSKLGLLPESVKRVFKYLRSVHKEIKEIRCTVQNTLKMLKPHEE